MRVSALRLFPVATVALLLLPVVAGLAGTLLPAFGVHPAAAGQGFTLAPWRELFDTPGLAVAIRLTLTTGLGATLLSVAVALAFAAGWHGSPAAARLRRALPVLLAVPHAAFAIGFAFLAAPSGWVVRLLSPWATGWTRPPDLALIQDPWGIAMTLALVCKEVPFLLLVIAGALGQTGAGARLAVARSLGYGPVTGWLKVVLPAVYPQMRLPVLAVLAYSLSAVEPALVLGPGAPPPLVPLLLRWFADPDLATMARAAAGAVLHLGLVALCCGLWLGGERAAAIIGRAWTVGGDRRGPERALRLAGGIATAAAVLCVLGALLALAVWAFARTWRFGEALPAAWTLETVLTHGPGLARPAWSTAAIAAAAVGISLLLGIGCLEAARRSRRGGLGIAVSVLYLPLLIPGITFLFGVQVLLVAAGLDGSWGAVVWVHLLYVLPYTLLALADPWLALDPRYERAARALGAGAWRTFVRVRLGLLLRPVLGAAAIGFAVSAGQYLPTLFAGAGRIDTLTTEAVVTASGADRRVVAVHALAQASLPLLAFAAALAVPAWLHRRRKGMQSG